MISHEEKERIAAHKLARAKDGVAITQGRRLFNEMKTAALSTGGGSIAGLVAGTDDDAYLRYASREHLFHQNPERGFAGAVPVHQSLQGKRSLGFARGGDDSFLNLHGCLTFPMRRRFTECPASVNPEDRIFLREEVAPV